MELLIIDEAGDTNGNPSGCAFVYFGGGCKCNAATFIACSGTDSLTVASFLVRGMSDRLRIPRCPALRVARTRIWYSTKRRCFMRNILYAAQGLTLQYLTILAQTLSTAELFAELWLTNESCLACQTGWRLRQLWLCRFARESWRCCERAVPGLRDIIRRWWATGRKGAALYGLFDKRGYFRHFERTGLLYWLYGS